MEWEIIFLSAMIPQEDSGGPAPPCMPGHNLRDCRGGRAPGAP